MQAGRLQELYDRYKDRVQFFIVYIHEAHAADGRSPIRVNTSKLEWISEPKSAFERFQVANTCIEDLKLTIPCLLDDMENATDKAYSGWPDRLYLVGKDGRIAFQGRPGPRGFRPEELAAAIGVELKKIGG